MKGLLGLIVLLSTCMIIYCQTPDMPKSFPDTWHSWVLHSIVRDKVIVSTGQLIAFNIQQKYSCRYDQQNLLNPKNIRPSDFCDYSTGYHYYVNNSIGKPDCVMKKMNDSLKAVKYPDSFLQNAKYIGKDHVNQRDCHHFYAPSVSDGFKNFGMDLWFTTDSEKLPCQISVTDGSSNPATVSTYAFDGISSQIPPDAMGKCQFPKSICVEEDYVCRVKNTSDPVAVQGALGWVCNPNNLDCSPIQPGGKNYFPNDLMSHANWAFNAYYQKNKSKQGSASCDFGGLAELIPPKFVIQKRGFLDNLKLLFEADIVCHTM